MTKTRIALLALALAPASLAGCGGGTPQAPYANLEMQAPVAAGTPASNEDPVLKAERDYNAQFAQPTRP